MSTDSLVTLIGTLGFPIVMCGTLCFYIYKVQIKLQEIVSQNTKNLEKLIDRLDKIIKYNTTSFYDLSRSRKE